MAVNAIVSLSANAYFAALSVAHAIAHTATYVIEIVTSSVTRSVKGALVGVLKSALHPIITMRDNVKIFVKSYLYFIHHAKTPNMPEFPHIRINSLNAVIAIPGAITRALTRVFLTASDAIGYAKFQIKKHRTLTTLKVINKQSRMSRVCKLYANWAYDWYLGGIVDFVTGRKGVEHTSTTRLGRFGG